MKKLILSITILLSIVACNPYESSIILENNLSGAIIENAKWGDITLATTLIPGESTNKFTLEEYNYYDIELPAEYKLKFYLNVSGDKVYLETKAIITLDKDEDIVININDSTAVINPLLESLN